ncbi:MAG: chromosome segregation protein SMC [Thermoleophilia bacterium]
MFLKSVKARGFKSFGRPVEFGFEPGITVVVGPNGSGKSNIADAVVWAMGEQSPSALRGATMQDIIFSGSDKLSPGGMAEVEITFDNASGQIPIEFSEVTVGRRVYRDGDSSYFINRSACRLIDVAELLSDAGLGRDGHSIISQGKVDSILESKPIERRSHIEEAAGLGKFKKRRRRAELKLEAVRRNMERLADVEEEVKAQLRPLKRQATAAERSARLDLELARTQARLFKGRLEVLNAQLSDARSASQMALERRAELEAQLTSTAAQRRQTEELLTGSLQQHKHLADRFYSLKSRRDALDNRQEAMSGRREMIGQGTRRAEARLENLGGQIERVAAELKRAESERAEGEARLRQIETELGLRQGELAKVEEEINRRRQQSEEKTRRVGELSALQDRYAHQIDYLSQRQEKVAGTMERALQEAQAHRSELTQLDDTVRLETEKLAGWREKAATAESALGAMVEERALLQGERQDLASELRRVAEDMQIAKARLTFISASEDDRSGLPAAAKQIAESHDVKPLVELIDVDPGYEKALSAVLGSKLFALTVNDIGRAGTLLREAMDGRLGSIEFLLPQPGAVAPGAETGDYLIDHVTVPEGQRDFVTALLTRVRVVDEIDSPEALTDDGVLVTRDGVVYRAGERILSYKADPPSSVVLRHRNERRQLEGEREDTQTRYEQLQTDIAALDARLGELEAPRAEAEQQARRVAREIQAIEEGLAGAERKRRVLSQKVEIKETSRTDLQAEESKLSGELAQVRQKLEETEHLLAEAGGLPGAAGGAGMGDDETLAVNRQSLSKTVTDLQISAARVRERERVAALAIERTGPTLRRLRRELSATTFELDAYTRLGPATDQLLAFMERLHAVFGRVLGGVEGQLKEGEEESNRHSSALRSLSQAEAELQQQLHRASDTTTEREVGLTRLKDQVQEQNERLAAIREKHPEAGIDDEAAAVAEELDEVQEHIQRLLKRRELIGPVNPLAQKEYEEMLERQQFLEEQRIDLEKSLKELKSLIKELTGRIESSFNETFEAVRRNFVEVIGALFPGGEGRLTMVEPPAPELQDGEEPLPEDDPEADMGFSGDRRGIEISVKPARKAVKSLSLLSGGERSLVAIGFLFSIFLARPAPFYILDEVEAALDDLNIDRLLNMLRQYQNRTQFIVITHQKRTMEVADFLYGVSMGADGTSKILSRRMPEADAEPVTGAAEAAGADPEAGFDEEPVVAVTGAEQPDPAAGESESADGAMTGAGESGSLGGGDSASGDLEPAAIAG